MKRKIIFIFMLVITVITLCACETQSGNRITSGKDVQTFTYAYIYLGDTKIAEGYITQWRDYSNSDTIQIMINGKYYLTHYSCVVMIADPAQGNLAYSDQSYQDYGGN